MPLAVAEDPSTPWKKRGIKMMPPNMPKAVKNITTSETATMRFLNRDSGIIGSGERLSAKTKSPSITAAVREIYGRLLQLAEA